MPDGSCNSTSRRSRRGSRTLEMIDGAPVPADAAGRTDAGVHAAGQVISFVLRRSWRADQLLSGPSMAIFRAT
jgi:tRNA U38,U39,U40 pseudouridine synthase TruA